MTLSDFHPAVASWFEQTFDAASDVQLQAWPSIQAKQHTLIAAPTGCGKTLAAFLAVIDDLIKQGLQTELPNETQVLYVSPLKALSNDIRKNLEQPLNGIGQKLLELLLPDVAINAQSRTGDTSQSERAAIKRTPPHILVTTPESLYLLLTSDSGRQMLSTVKTVIVDEIHALAGNKRGAHLSLSLERLEHVTHFPPIRIGLSATQKPIEDMAKFLLGNRSENCNIIDTGHVRKRDLQIEVTGSPLEAIMAGEVWEELYTRLCQLIEQHSTTLIFVNTRRLAERAAAALAERLGEEHVTAHHGSLAKEHRLQAEQKLKQGQLKALVATASLELGIDIGDVDLVCQLGSPHAITAFLQRVGRSGHRLGETPKGRLFPLSRDDLVECTALLAAVQRYELDKIPMPSCPLDVLAQQIVAEVACAEWEEQKLFETFRQAWLYRDITLQQFTAVTVMLSEGFHLRRGRRGAYLHRDAVHGLLRPRRGAKLTALTNGGAIPDQFDYDVFLQPEGLKVGTLDEDFSFDSLPGDVFQLGNNSYRMLKIEQGKVYVEDAHGQPPKIPFWFGEGPGRSDELSAAVSSLLTTMNQLLEQGQVIARQYLIESLQLTTSAAEQLVLYLAMAKAALTHLPTQKKIIFERFFDETGDMHLVIHSPYGSRVNRAWGLALRKRFCRRFNFELQAAATEDTIVLSLGPTHSFPLEEPISYLHSTSVKQVLIQALLAAPMFPTRWRWVANTALAVPRNRAGKKVPAYFQRNDAEDLVAVIFPDQLACQENILDQREVPDHPLVNQTLQDCMYELMDIEGLEHILSSIESGDITVTCKDLASPSPLAQEILNARPYAFLDDAPAEERRTRAVQQRRFTDPESAAKVGRLNPEAIERVRQEAWPEVNNADELHDALMVMGFLTEEEGQRGQTMLLAQAAAEVSWQPLMQVLQKTGRAAVMKLSTQQYIWIATEHLALLQQLFPDQPLEPSDIKPLPDKTDFDETQAIKEIIRSRIEVLGPVTVDQLANPLNLATTKIELALSQLQHDGFVISGHFSQNGTDLEWCERGLLARIHRYTLKQLRSEVEPVSPSDFMRFLFHWHGIDKPRTGETALFDTLQQLEGLSLPTSSWEEGVLPARIQPYQKNELDQLCSSGKLMWLRLHIPNGNSSAKQKSPAGKSTGISFVTRSHLKHWRAYAPLPEIDALNLSGKAQKAYVFLQQQGASFFDDIQSSVGLLKTELETALGELAAGGLVIADSFQGLRMLTTSQQVLQRRNRRYPAYNPFDSVGRWSLLQQPNSEDGDKFQHCEYVAKILLRRYGVVFRKLLVNECNLPTWRDLLYVYRRMEARGELRGGRFVKGFSGEQFALPEAVTSLRQVRKQAKAKFQITLSAADPLNLTGIITPNQRITAQANQRILYQDGTPIAVGKSNQVNFLIKMQPEEEWEIRTTLSRKQQVVAHRSKLSGVGRH